MNELTKKERLIAACLGNTLAGMLIVSVLVLFAELAIYLAIYVIGFLLIANIDIGLKWHYQNGIYNKRWPLLSIASPQLILYGDIFNNAFLHGLIILALNLSPHVDGEYTLAAIMLLIISRLGLLIEARKELD